VFAWSYQSTAGLSSFQPLRAGIREVALRPTPTGTEWHRAQLFEAQEAKSPIGLGKISQYLCHDSLAR
jgi:hypothetical protein